MPSILPDYEYDIFISYRHKDNKGDQWVTGFVTALRAELEATFKEDIHIYFDENPHDGLHETHDVDESLKEKIKCLIFIPIVSQTYCDPNAFAWQKEFLAFIDFAKTDQFGLDIKLTSGNVSKRVLPVRIHAIDEADKNLFETALGGVLRPVDFIYAETGVNRPLKPTDSDEKNFNKTDYANQINKVANAVKRVFEGIQLHEQGENEQINKVTTNKTRLSKGLYNRRINPYALRTFTKKNQNHFLCAFLHWTGIYHC